MAQQDLQASTLFDAISPIFGKNIECGSVVTDNGLDQMNLTSRHSDASDIWDMQN